MQVVTLKGLTDRLHEALLTENLRDAASTPMSTGQGARDGVSGVAQLLGCGADALLRFCRGLHAP